MAITSYVPMTCKCCSHIQLSPGTGPGGATEIRDGENYYPSVKVFTEVRKLPYTRYVTGSRFRRGLCLNANSEALRRKAFVKAWTKRVQQDTDLEVNDEIREMWSLGILFAILPMPQASPEILKRRWTIVRK